MNIIIQSILLSFGICYISIPVIISIASIKKLYDEPTARKIHCQPVPALGGVALFAAVLISSTFFINFSISSELQYLIPSSIILFFIGLKDDLLVISPFKKFAGQILSAFILIYKGNFLIDSFHGFLGYNSLGPILSVVFTGLTILMIINAFNLIDGINGLASSLSIISCTFFGLVFYFTNEISYSILSFTLVGALISFLAFNWTPAKIFMGDTGSLFLGLVNAILVIKFTNVGDINIASINISQNALVGLAVLFIPLSDTLRVFAIRILSGKSPFYSDVNHIHHLLLRRGLSHSQVTLYLSILAIGYIVLAINIQTLGINTAVLILFIIGFLIPLLIDKTSYKRIRAKSNVNNEESIQTDITTTFISTPINTSELNN
jgi:UDP-N-acetylmuramyl pentapeptide phosphotransferase/UDP-N-acetylglucosamine-1-phosphate transferase